MASEFLNSFYTKVSEKFNVEIPPEIKGQQKMKIKFDTEPVFRKTSFGNYVWKNFVIDQETKVITGTENSDTGTIVPLTPDQAEVLKSYGFTV